MWITLKFGEVGEESEALKKVIFFMTNYQFILEPYKGLKSRHTCPACKRPKVFSKYINIKTGNHLPEQYGRCNREESCGYHLNPYKDGYLRENHNILKDHKPAFSSTPKPKELAFIPEDIFKRSLNKYDQNNFVQFLKNRIGEQKTKELIKRFFIGTSSYWQGSTVFWLIDQDMRIAGGQVILFNHDGKTKKETRPDGSKKRFNSWVHTALQKSYQKQDYQIPNWLITYIENNPKFPCLFGLPQLKSECSTKPIAIVEAAKTAIIASAYLPDYIWMAIGGMSYLNQERITPLEGRNITLFPDKGAFQKWKLKAESMNQFANINVSNLLESKQAQAGSDIADYLAQKISKSSPQIS